MRANLIEIGGIETTLKLALALYGRESDSHIEKNIYFGKWTDTTTCPHTELPAINASSLVGIGPNDMQLMKDATDFLYLIKVWVKLTASVEWWESSPVRHAISPDHIIAVDCVGDKAEETRFVCLSYTVIRFLYMSYLEHKEDMDSQDWSDFERLVKALPFNAELLIPQGQ